MASSIDRLGALGFDSYDAYLRSPEWKALRRRVGTAVKWTCPCGAVATQIHHRTYARIGREKLSDLEAVCKGCHSKIHEYRAQGATLEAATTAVLEGGSPRQTNKEKRRAKRGRQKAERRARIAAGIAHQEELRAASLRAGSVRTASLDETARRIESLRPQKPIEPRKKLTKAERRAKRRNPNFKPNRPPVGGGMPVKVVRVGPTETSRPAGAPGSHRRSSSSSTA